jgi:hypothetical protein
VSAKERKLEMHDGRGALRLGLALLCVVALAACGSSSGSDATTLLKQTFSGSHKVNSGNLSLSLNMTPSGSSTTPISLSFGGPFQSLGPGKLPESDFTVSLSGGGRSASLGILSTGSTGYVTLQGTAYQLPQSTFQKLESSFSQLGSPSSTSSGASTLSRLGIHPLNWLVSPTIVGDETIAGTATTHIRAGVNVHGLLNDVNTLVQKASTVGVSGASQLSSGLSASTRNQIASEIQNPSVDVWTGNGDKTIRRLTINFTLSGSGLVASLFNGVRTASLGLTMQYTNLNQPQTINAPTSVRPYTEFAAKLRTFAQSLQASLGTIAGGGAGSAGSAAASSSGTSTTAGTSNNPQAYSQCIQAAGNDVTKMQQCAPLLNGG